MAASHTTIQVAGPRVRQRASTFIRCIVHTQRKARMITLLFVASPSFTTNSTELGAQLHLVLPDKVSVTTTTTPTNRNLTLSVRSETFGQWVLPSTKQLASQSIARRLLTLQTTLSGFAPPMMEEAQLTLCRFFQHMQWAQQSLDRPFIVHWEGERAPHRRAVLQTLLHPPKDQLPTATSTPPVRVLVVTHSVEQLTQWALTVQAMTVPFVAGRQDTGITITTIAHIASHLDAFTTPTFDVVVVDDAHKLLRVQPQFTEVIAILRTARTTLLLMPHLLPRGRIDLPYLLQLMGEKVTVGSRDALFWRGDVVRNHKWPRPLLASVFFHSLAVATPRAEWARAARMGHVVKVSRQRVSTFFSVAQTWEYLLAGGAVEASLMAPDGQGEPPLRLPPRQGSASSVKTLCNETDKHSRRNSKWSWLSAKLQEGDKALPLVVCSEDAACGLPLITRALRTSKTHATLRVRTLHGLAAHRAATVQAFNAGLVDVLCIHPGEIGSATLNLVRTLVFWEPCTDAFAEQRVLVMCSPGVATPVHIATLVTQFPLRQLQPETIQPMPQTDAWLQRKARELWPRQLPTTRRLPSTWPRRELLAVLGGRHARTHNEAVMERNDAMVLQNIPLTNFITNKRISAIATAAPPKAGDTWRLSHAAEHRGAPVVLKGGVAPNRRHVKTKQARTHTVTGRIKALVQKIKTKTSTTWRPWCPKGMTLGVWSRRLTPLVTQLAQEGSRQGWTLAQFVEDPTFMPAVRALAFPEEAGGNTEDVHSVGSSSGSSALSMSSHGSGLSSGSDGSGGMGSSGSSSRSACSHESGGDFV